MCVRHSLRKAAVPLVAAVLALALAAPSPAADRATQFVSLRIQGEKDKVAPTKGPLLRAALRVSSQASSPQARSFSRTGRSSAVTSRHQSPSGLRASQRFLGSEVAIPARVLGS